MRTKWWTSSTIWLARSFLLLPFSFWQWCAHEHYTRVNMICYQLDEDHAETRTSRSSCWDYSAIRGNTILCSHYDMRLWGYILIWQYEVSLWYDTLIWHFNLAIWGDNITMTLRWYQARFHMGINRKFCYWQQDLSEKLRYNVLLFMGKRYVSQQFHKENMDWWIFVKAQTSDAHQIHQ